jgi:acylphosphatase
MAQKRAHVYIKGRVQGVWFRASTKEVARKLGLKGWVRNLSDGRVEAVFEGEEDKVMQAVEWCHEGPPGAAVADVEVLYEEPQGEEDFHIRY